MAPSQTALAHMDLSELRRVRTVLRREAAQASHWRRIVRARLDLTVARAALPEPLGQGLTVDLELEAMTTLSAHAELVEIARGHGDAFPVGELQRLRAAEQSLAEYESHVHRALMVATDVLVERLCLAEAVR